MIIVILPDLFDHTGRVTCQRHNLAQPIETGEYIVQFSRDACDIVASKRSHQLPFGNAHRICKIAVPFARLFRPGRTYQFRGHKHLFHHGFSHLLSGFETCWPGP